MPWSRERTWLCLAWGPLLLGVVIQILLWLLFLPHERAGGHGGERPSAVTVCYGVFLVVSAGGTLAALASFGGIRSWRSALVNLPGALLGCGISGFNAFICYIGFTRSLEGGSWDWGAWF